MEKLFSLEYGVAGVCVLLTFMVLLRVGEFLWALREKKENLSETAISELTKAVRDNTAAILLLEHRFSALESIVAELPKLKTDLRRFYSALKEVAGDRWPEIRDEIMKDGLTI